jgi:glutamine synthetase
MKHKAAQYGLRATMAPKPLKEHLCTGAHAHISIHPPSGQEHVLAGILEDLQSLCAFGLASYDSYSRVTGISNAAGSWVGWGTENRYMPIRAIEPAHWELRYLDVTANMYLALLMTMTAGIHGLEENIVLKHSDCRLNPVELGEEERTELGIVKPLPTTLKDSIKMLEESTTFDAMLGKSLKEHYVAVKKVDESIMSTWSEDQRRKLVTTLF